MELKIRFLLFQNVKYAHLALNKALENILIII